MSSVPPQTKTLIFFYSAKHAQAQGSSLATFVPDEVSPKKEHLNVLEEGSKVQVECTRIKTYDPAKGLSPHWYDFDIKEVKTVGVGVLLKLDKYRDTGAAVGELMHNERMLMDFDGIQCDAVMAGAKKDNALYERLFVISNFVWARDCHALEYACNDMLLAPRRKFKKMIEAMPGFVIHMISVFCTQREAFRARMRTAFTKRVCIPAPDNLTEQLHSLNM